MKTLRREGMQKTKAMLDGQHFENMVTAYTEGAPLDLGHEWAPGIQLVGDIVHDAALQVKLSKQVVINNVEFLLYGILDALKAGTIYDIKFSKTYKRGKYLESPQHPMYFELCSEAREFTYLVSNGSELFTETYRRDNTQSIRQEVSEFMAYLDACDLTDVYCAHWRSKY